MCARVVPDTHGVMFLAVWSAQGWGQRVQTRMLGSRGAELEVFFGPSMVVSSLYVILRSSKVEHLLQGVFWGQICSIILTAMHHE